jgi:hypothetical protein
MTRVIVTMAYVIMAVLEMTAPRTYAANWAKLEREARASALIEDHRDLPATVTAPMAEAEEAAIAAAIDSLVKTWPD